VGSSHFFEKRRKAGPSANLKPEKIMKPVISEGDYKLLYELLVNQKNNEGKHLGQGITNAILVKDEEMDQKIVRLNSEVEIKDLTLSKLIRMKIVMPDRVDLKNFQVSVFAPLSVALIGFRENDVIPWKTPVGHTSFKIMKVLNS
jgi:regulator of nucleoside diphosphate kinase